MFYLTTHILFTVIWRRNNCKGDIAPNEAIARSEFEVQRQIYTE